MNQPSPRKETAERIAATGAFINILMYALGCLTTYFIFTI